MGRFRAAAQVAAFFLIAMCGSRHALACEGCNRVSLASSDSDDATDGQRSVEMPDFRHRSAWQLTYRSEPADTVWQPAPSERFPGMNVTLDDSRVFGLRFQLDYGWKR